MSQSGSGDLQPTYQSSLAHPHDIAFSGVSRLRAPVHFVQIGAADGRRVDPINVFVKRYRWHGLLVEPLPDLYAQLVANYGDCEGLVFDNVAVTERDETGVITRIPPDCVGRNGVPDWAFGASSLLPERTRFGRANSPPELFESLSSAAVAEQVRCVSLATLLQRHGIAKIDVLQVDTEGYDARIIRQLDVARYRPVLINMEWQWLSPAEREEIMAMLVGQGYVLQACGGDMLASQVSLDEWAGSLGRPAPDDIARYFPTVAGLSQEAGPTNATDQEKTGLAIVVHRTRGERLRLLIDDQGLRFVQSIDGNRTFQQIAAILGMPIEHILDIGFTLRRLYVLD